jgi:hypothetical protein
MKKQRLKPEIQHYCGECKNYTPITDEFLSTEGESIMGNCPVMGGSVLKSFKACKEIKI